MANLCDGCKSREAQKGTGCCGRASQSRLQHYRLPVRLLSGGSSAKGNTAQCPSLIATSADFQGRFRLTSKAVLSAAFVDRVLIIQLPLAMPRISALTSIGNRNSRKNALVFGVGRHK